MAEVYEFPGAEEEDPHWSGRARCLACGHVWVACAPVGVIDGLECPQCHAEKGIAKALVFPPTRWECGCGNDLFAIDREGAICVNCGRAQRW